MSKRLGVLILFTCLAGAAAAQAQSYPTRTITLTVTAAAGGVTDVVARALGERLSQTWGQQVVIENKGGAAHVVGAQSVAKAAPDGYSLLVAEAGTFTINPTLYGKGKLPYDEEKDFIPITGIVRINQALLGHPSLPANNVRELIELASKKPGELTYGTAGIGSAPHMNMVLLESMANVKLVPVHYRGAAPALTDVIAGHVNLMSVASASRCRRCAPARSRSSASAAASASLSRPTFRPSPKAACRTTKPRPGSACSPPPARRARS
jgi:tripartite-type tricarboxylate transporter receptor subunit TctC